MFLRYYTLLLLCTKTTINICIFFVTAGKITASVFVFFTGTLWSKSDVTEENSSELEAFRPR